MICCENKLLTSGTIDYEKDLKDGIEKKNLITSVTTLSHSSVSFDINK